MVGVSVHMVVRYFLTCGRMWCGWLRLSSAQPYIGVPRLGGIKQMCPRSAEPRISMHAGVQEAHSWLPFVAGFCMHMPG